MRKHHSLRLLLLSVSLLALLVLFGNVATPNASAHGISPSGVSTQLIPITSGQFTIPIRRDGAVTPFFAICSYDVFAPFKSSGQIVVQGGITCSSNFNSTAQIIITLNELVNNSSTGIAQAILNCPPPQSSCLGHFFWPLSTGNWQTEIQAAGNDITVSGQNFSPFVFLQ